jgi:hypothetical protein
MEFNEALYQINSGTKVTRLIWIKGTHVELYTPEAGSRLTKQFLVVSTSIDDLVPWEPAQEDLLATDWVIVE